MGFYGTEKGPTRDVFQLRRLRRATQFNSHPETGHVKGLNDWISSACAEEEMALIRDHPLRKSERRNPRADFVSLSATVLRADRAGDSVEQAAVHWKTRV